MSEHLRDIAAKAVWDARRDRLTLGGRHIEIGDWPPPDSEESDCGPYPMADDYRAIGEAVVDAVTPHIERALLERLIAEAETDPEELRAWYGPSESMSFANAVADWLRSRIEAQP